MTHGDFDYDYLERLVLGPDGRRRLRRVSFAAHFDSLMFGRRGIARPPDEASLNPYRARFAAMFAQLRREHKVRFFLAHTMTVTPGNLGQVAGVVRDCRHLGFGMFSFQPAAFVGDQRRWQEDYRAITGDQVWAQIERGAATDAGGFLDIVADFSVYAGVILGLAVALPATRLACVALLTAYYISGTAFLALSSLAERRRQRLGDDRSLRFVGGLAEGTETIAVYIALFLLPQHATVIVWAFTAAVAITAAQRVVTGVRLLRAPAPGGPAGVPAAAAAGTGAAVPLPLRRPNRGPATAGSRRRPRW